MIKWFIIFLGIASGVCARTYNEDEKYMLEDLKQEPGKQRGLFGLNQQIKKPKCFLEDFTASCCIQMKYRTRDEKNSFVPKFHKACIEVGLNLTQLRVFARAYYDTIILNNGSQTTHEIKHVENYLGKFCWGLPEPVDSLNLCMWIYHLDVKPSIPRAEFCMAFVVTEVLRIQFDCLKWKEGEFSLTNKIKMPKETMSLITLKVGQNGFKFEVKNKWVKRAFKLIKELWDKVKKLFYKGKDHEKFLTKPADNK